MIRYRTVRLNDIAKLTVEGTLDFAGTRELLLQIATDANTRGQNLLVDLRQAKGPLSFPDVHRLTRVLDEFPDVFTGRIALLDLYDQELEKAQFFEFSAGERGYQVRTFLDEDRAVEWLERGTG